MYEAFLAWLEASALGELARHSPWLYPASNLAHVLAAGLLFGSIAVLDLRLILGAPHTVPVAALAKLAVPMAVAGFLVAVPAGLVLLAAEASALGVNSAFAAKGIALGVALSNVLLVHRRYRPAFAGYGDGALSRLHGLLSLASWAGVILAGRAMAYI